MPRFAPCLSLALILIGVASRGTQAAPIVITGDPGDFELVVGTPSGGLSISATISNTSGFRLFDGFASGHNTVFIFDLSIIPSGVPVFEAGLGAVLAEIRTNSAFNTDPFHGDLYGVGFSSSVDPLILPPGLDFYAGPAPGPAGTVLPGTTDVLIQNNFVIETPMAPPSRLVQTSALGTTTLANYINTFRPSGPDGNFLFLRISPDVSSFPPEAGYFFFSGDSDSPPTLTINLVPEPSTLALAAIGAGLIGAASLRRVRPSRRGDENP